MSKGVSDKLLQQNFQRLDLPDADIYWSPAWLDTPEADKLLQTLTDTLAWEAREIKMFGRVLPQPRLTAWYGEPAARYTYSGLSWDPLPWTEELAALRKRLERLCLIDFNSVLANLYRDGADSMGWHSDDEKELGPEPVIASLSLGAERDFQFRHRSRKSLPTETIRLTHGSLLLMAGSTQHHWKHQLPKRKRVSAPRINLTFRQIKGGGLAGGA